MPSKATSTTAPAPGPALAADSTAAPQRAPVPVALTVAGSDSGGGAGIQADLKTFQALRTFGTSVLTAVTAQNTLGVTAVQVLPASLVTAQLDAVLGDFPVGAVKTGMLANADLVAAFAERLRGPVAQGLPVVADTVFMAKSGHSLLEPAAVAALRELLLPIAAVVTPNLPEASGLVGFPVEDPASQERAGRALLDLGAGAALMKGGHGTGEVVVDLLVWRDGTGGVCVERFESPRLHTRHTHGTGCTLSAAIAAFLARGLPLVDAVAQARAYVFAAIAQAPGLGAGHGPLHHGHPDWPLPVATGPERTA